MSKLFSSRRACASLAGLSALALGLAGCGGGGGNGNGNGGGANNASLPNVSVTALTAGNSLRVFNARTPGTARQIIVNGLRANEQLIGIDFRYYTGNALYGLGSLNGSYQLYTIATVSANTATATAVGVPFTPATNLGPIGFDFNPVADRIRVVDAATRANLRLDPTSGALAATDTNVTYDPSDVNAGDTPTLVGAAYTNNAAGAASTVNYAIDRGQGTLVTQGRPATGGNPVVSPNTGLLFTVGTLSTAPGTGDVGFDITPTSLGADGERGLVAFAGSGDLRPRLYEVNLTTGALTGGAALNLPANSGVLDIAVTANNF